MSTPSENLEIDFVRDMRTRSAAEGGVFWHTDEVLAVFEAEAAQKVNAVNFGDLTLPDKLADLMRGRTGEQVFWRHVRAAWLAQLRILSGAEGIGQLAARMEAMLEKRLDRSVDLVWVAQEVCTQTLLPVVVDGLSAADAARIFRDQAFKLKRLLA